MSIINVVESVYALAKNPVITIDGHSIPLKSFGGLGSAIPKIWSDMKQGADAGTVIRDIAPEVLPVIETLANAFFPGAGDAVELMTLVLAYSHQMTDSERDIWFDRARGAID